MPKEIINQCEQRMQKTIEALKKDFATIRTGKANPSIFKWCNGWILWFTDANSSNC